MNAKGKITLFLMAAILLGVWFFSGKIIEVNQAGNYQVKQAAITGTLTARMTPGLYMQNFGTITKYRAVATVGFGNEKGEGAADISAIPVIFNDGSRAKISGMVRIALPNDPDKLIEIKKKYSSGYTHFIKSGIVPVVKNIVRLSSNLYSAQESYTALAQVRANINDQLTNGVYGTKTEVQQIKRITGEIETFRKTVILMKDGIPVRTPNILQTLGCEVVEVTIDVPQFDKKVNEMIAARKDETMKTELAKQAAIRAQQDRLTIIEEGKAKVAKVRYEKEQEKIAAVTKAEQQLAVAKLEKAAAVENKQTLILEGQGLAAKKRAIMSADGALSQKLNTYQAVQARWAEAIEKSNVQWVPTIIMGQDNSAGNGASTLIRMLEAKTAKELALDMNVKRK